MTMPTDVKLNADGVADERLSEILAGCEGVPDKYPEPNWPFGIDTKTATKIMVHVARLDPATVSSIISELQARRALDNSKPTPAVGDDGLVVAWRVRQRIFELKNKWSGWFVSEDRPEWGDGLDVEYQPLVPASALAAAHSQHEADVARIAELTQALQRIFNVLTFPVDGRISPRRWDLRISDPNGSVEYVAEIAEAALAKVKP